MQKQISVSRVTCTKNPQHFPIRYYFSLQITCEVDRKINRIQPTGSSQFPQFVDRITRIQTKKGNKKMDKKITKA